MEDAGSVVDSGMLDKLVLDKLLLVDENGAEVDSEEMESVVLGVLDVT